MVNWQKRWRMSQQRYLPDGVAIEIDRGDRRTC